MLTRINTFPTKVAELNSWWIPALGVPPKTIKSASSSQAEDPIAEDGETEEDAEDDWREFFEELAPPSSKASQPQKRIHTLSVHASLHSLASHRAVFTRAWLSLLPLLKHKDKRVIRVLQVLHRGILPHLTRAVLIMDWIASCVDLGGTSGLLALNGLFVLMKEYNLCVSVTQSFIAEKDKSLKRNFSVIIPLSIRVCMPFWTETSCMSNTVPGFSGLQRCFCRRRKLC